MTDTGERRVAIVTGAGRGIGRAIALALAAKRIAVVVTGRTEKNLAEVVGEVTHGGGKARHVVADVRAHGDMVAAVTKARDTFGRLDIVVANAGIAGRAAFGAADGPACARDIIDTNLMGTYHTFDAAAPHLEPGGRLVAVSSVLAKFGVPEYAAYCASKAGVLGMVRATAHELAPRRITCNAIVPGWVDTEMAESGIRDIAAGIGQTPEQTRKDAERAVPLGRFLAPAEIAAFVVFLCSREADGITGQALSMCGGATAFGG